MRFRTIIEVDAIQWRGPKHIETLNKWLQDKDLFKWNEGWRVISYTEDHLVFILNGDQCESIYKSEWLSWDGSSFKIIPNYVFLLKYEPIGNIK